MRKLTELKIGDSGIIDSIDDENFNIKLLEMGCIPGELITVEQIAITGDPINIYVSGYNLSLRKEEAKNIIVKKIIK
jgi:ferrous iron transport protein A